MRRGHRDEWVSNDDARSVGERFRITFANTTITGNTIEAGLGAGLNMQDAGGSTLR